jgi:ComF family protein
MAWEKVWDVLLDLFFPPRCPVCDKVLKKSEKICRNCKKELKWVKDPVCLRCGKPLEETTKEYCHDCDGRDFHYKRGYALWVYEGGAKRSVGAFKYKGRQEYKRFYGQMLCDVYGKELRRIGITTIVPVPVHKERKRLRGYNQAELIAVELGERLGLPVEVKGLKRVRATKPQKGLGLKAREENLRRAFACDRRSFWGKDLKKVLLVDDIYTTGSTIEACAKCLLEAGAKEVYFITLCIGNG